MKLYQLLQSFEFEEIFPTVNVMFPNAQLHRDILKSIRYALQYPTYHIQKVIKFELMEDPDSNDMFVGAMIAVSSPHGMYAWERKSKRQRR